MRLIEMPYFETIVEFSHQNFLVWGDDPYGSLIETGEAFS